LLAALLINGGRTSLLDQLAGIPFGVGHFGAAANAISAAFSRNFASAVMVFILAIGIWGWSMAEPIRPSARIRMGHAVAGPLHLAGHVLIAVGLLWRFATVVLQPESNHGVIAFGLWAAGGALGAIWVSLYLLFSNLLFGLHDNEVFSAQGIEH